jgi:hypothetical protein
MMLLISIGALLIISGVVLAAIRTLKSGRLSEVRQRGPSDAPDTLEPKGRGRRLSAKADLPGLAMIALGALILLAVAIVR